MIKTNYISKFLISHYAMDDVNLFALYNTKTDLSEERRKEGKICKKCAVQFSLNIVSKVTIKIFASCHL